jgi:putative ABC transport system substrate-binding protein
MPARREVFCKLNRPNPWTRFADIPEGRLEILPTLAEELVRGEPDIVVALDPSALRAAQQATRTISSVTILSGEPIGTGIVPNLSRPGSNITGMTMLSSRLSARRLALLKEVMPQLTRAAVLFNPGDERNGLDWHQTVVAARAHVVRLHPPVEVPGPDTFAEAFAVMRCERVGALHHVDRRCDICAPHPAGELGDQVGAAGDL